MKNLTETTPTTAAELFALPQINQTHLKALPPEELEEFKRLYEHKFDTLIEHERDAFIAQVQAIIPPEELWEYNHEKITMAINQYLEEYDEVPPRSHLIKATGLSRQTIYRHMSEMENGARDEDDTFEIMTGKVRAKVLKAALQGNLQAAKMVLGRSETRTRAKKEVVTNYVQINKTVINQQIIQQLNPEALNRIEEIIAEELKEKDSNGNLPS